jgi:thiamine biosynthesis lipoprotein
VTPHQEAVSSRRGRALGTDFVLATTSERVIDTAARVLSVELEAIDRSCSRFRSDSEIYKLQAAGGRSVGVSRLLFDAVTASVRASEQTFGAVDATVGNVLVALGYDRDFESIVRVADTNTGAPTPVIGWWSIDLDAKRCEIRVPDGLLLDLGSTAKALAADRAAERIAEVTRAGTLVSLGGDVAVAGEPPEGGWPIGIALGSGDPTSALRQTVSITGGGLASSSTETRSWTRGGRHLGHIIDPATGDVASDCWRLVSVAAPSCVEANTASTAAIVWGERALERLRRIGLPTRLENRHGEVVRLNRWPEDPSVSPMEVSDSDRADVAMSRRGVRAS